MTTPVPPDKRLSREQISDPFWRKRLLSSGIPVAELNALCDLALASLPPPSRDTGASTLPSRLREEKRDHYPDSKVNSLLADAADLIEQLQRELAEARESSIDKWWAAVQEAGTAIAHEDGWVLSARSAIAPSGEEIIEPKLPVVVEFEAWWLSQRDVLKLSPAMKFAAWNSWLACWNRAAPAEVAPSQAERDGLEPGDYLTRVKVKAVRGR